MSSDKDAKQVKCKAAARCQTLVPFEFVKMILLWKKMGENYKSFHVNHFNKFNYRWASSPTSGTRKLDYLMNFYRLHVNFQYLTFRRVFYKMERNIPTFTWTFKEWTLWWNCWFQGLLFSIFKQFIFELIKGRTSMRWPASKQMQLPELYSKNRCKRLYISWAKILNFRTSLPNWWTMRRPHHSLH